MALVADDLHMEKAICNVLQHVDLLPLPMLEGHTAIPMNTPVMSSAQQAIMISPSRHVSIVSGVKTYSFFGSHLIISCIQYWDHSVCDRAAEPTIYGNGEPSAFRSPQGSVLAPDEEMMARPNNVNHQHDSRHEIGLFIIGLMIIIL